jgi:AP2 domain
MATGEPYLSTSRMCNRSDVVTIKNSIANTRHGGVGSRLYNIWHGGKKRCRNQRDKDYSNYGGRGITWCDEWNSFAAFRDWALSHGYADGLSLDRVDNCRGYSPDNCRFATQSQQTQNTRKRRVATSQFRGVSKRKRRSPWTAQIKHYGKRIRIGSFATEEDAARAYDAKARELFGPLAAVNFPAGISPT